MVNNPLIRPYFLGGWHWGGALRFPLFNVNHPSKRNWFQCHVNKIYPDRWGHPGVAPRDCHSHSVSEGRGGKPVFFFFKGEAIGYLGYFWKGGLFWCRLLGGLSWWSRMDPTGAIMKTAGDRNGHCWSKKTFHAKKSKFNFGVNTELIRVLVQVWFRTSTASFAGTMT